MPPKSVLIPTHVQHINQKLCGYERITLSVCIGNPPLCSLIWTANKMASSTTAAGTDHQGSEMVNIRESQLHTIPPQVSDFVKKFVTPHVTNDGEKVYPISVNDLRGTNQIFFVKTTSDANQSNCKFMPGPGDMTIETTKVIEPGDELLFFYELPNENDKLKDDNDCSDLEKKSTGDKRK